MLGEIVPQRREEREDGIRRVCSASAGVSLYSAQGRRTFVEQFPQLRLLLVVECRMVPPIDPSSLYVAHQRALQPVSNA